MLNPSLFPKSNSFLPLIVSWCNTRPVKDVCVHHPLSNGLMFSQRLMASAAIQIPPRNRPPSDKFEVTVSLSIRPQNTGHPCLRPSHSLRRVGRLHGNVRTVGNNPLEIKALLEVQKVIMRLFRSSCALYVPRLQMEGAMPRPLARVVVLHLCTHHGVCHSLPTSCRHQWAGKLLSQVRTALSHSVRRQVLERIKLLHSTLSGSWVPPPVLKKTRRGSSDRWHAFVSHRGSTISTTLETYVFVELVSRTERPTAETEIAAGRVPEVAKCNGLQTIDTCSSSSSSSEHLPSNSWHHKLDSSTAPVVPRPHGHPPHSMIAAWYNLQLNT